MAKMNWEKANSKESLTYGRSHLQSTAAQRTLIKQLSREMNIPYENPVDRSHAATIIKRLLDAKRKGVTPKKRRPAVPIKGSFKKKKG